MKNLEPRVRMIIGLGFILLILGGLLWFALTHLETSEPGGMLGGGEGNGSAVLA